MAIFKKLQLALIKAVWLDTKDSKLCVYLVLPTVSEVCDSISRIFVVKNATL